MSPNYSLFSTPDFVCSHYSEAIALHEQQRADSLAEVPARPIGEPPRKTSDLEERAPKRNANAHA